MFHEGVARIAGRTGLALGWVLAVSHAAAAADEGWKRIGLGGVALETIAVQPSSADVLFAGTAPEWEGCRRNCQAAVWRSDDGGATWQAKTVGLRDVHRINAIAVGPESNTILAGGLTLDPTHLFRSTDAGESWQASTAGLPPPDELGGKQVAAIAFDPSRPATVYLGLNQGGRAGVWKSTDDGITWNDASGGLEDEVCGRGGCVLDLAVDPSQPDTLYAAMPVLSDVYKTTDGGISWAPTGAGLWAEELVVDPRHPATVWTTGTVPGLGGLAKSTDAGRTWARLDQQVGLPPFQDSSFRTLAVDPDDSDTLWMVVEDVFSAGVPLEAVYVSRDGGLTWNLADEGLEGVRVRELVPHGGAVVAATLDGVYRRVDPPASPFCVPGANGLCLGGSRFRVTAHWDDGRGNSGEAHPIRLTADTGAFWFFSSSNLELVVKVLDACVGFDHYWVFAAGLTNVGVEWTVVDTTSGETQRYESPSGAPFSPVLDTSTFTSCP